MQKIGEGKYRLAHIKKRQNFHMFLQSMLPLRHVYTALEHLVLTWVLNAMIKLLRLTREVGGVA